METDQELRSRLVYVTGDGPVWIERIHHASGKRLDDLAASVRLHRRRVRDD